MILIDNVTYSSYNDCWRTYYMLDTVLSSLSLDSFNLDTNPRKEALTFSLWMRNPSSREVREVT